MALDPAFVADCPYGPGAILLDDIVEIDSANDRVVARMPTHDDLPLTREQRAHPVRHPRHLNGGLLVHMTGILGFVHAYHLMGLRHADGWIGYGGRIYGARFLSLAEPGPPLILECRATHVRRGDTRIFARYDFRFTQEGKDVYASDQAAIWLRTGEGR